MCCLHVCVNKNCKPNQFIENVSIFVYLILLRWINDYRNYCFSLYFMHLCVSTDLSCYKKLIRIDPIDKNLVHVYRDNFRHVRV